MTWIWLIVIEPHLKRFEVVVVRFMQLHYKLEVLIIPFGIFDPKNWNFGQKVICFGFFGQKFQK